MDCHFLLQRIFPSQGLNPGLLHHRQILYHLSYREVLYTFVHYTLIKLGRENNPLVHSIIFRIKAQSLPCQADTLSDLISSMTPIHSGHTGLLLEVLYKLASRPLHWLFPLPRMPFLMTHSLANLLQTLIITSKRPSLTTFPKTALPTPLISLPLMYFSPLPMKHPDTCFSGRLRSCSTQAYLPHGTWEPWFPYQGSNPYPPH